MMGKSLDFQCPQQRPSSEDEVGAWGSGQGGFHGRPGEEGTWPSQVQMVGSLQADEVEEEGGQRA
jgi:hypothetical protein